MNSSYPFSLSEMARIEYESAMVEERYSAGRRDYGTGDLLTHAEVHALAEVGAEPGVTVLALAAPKGPCLSFWQSWKPRAF